MSDPILALSGPRACGKSTIAKHLVNKHGYTRIAFADALRDIAACAGEQLTNDRDYLARLGTTLRGLYPDFLLKIVADRIKAIDGPVVIEDIRFPTELKLCKTIGPTTIRFDISREEQLKRLLSRDGKTGSDAERLLDCMDERCLSGDSDWDKVIIAEGDFSRLASEIHSAEVRS